jgi:hypothetical protein
MGLAIKLSGGVTLLGALSVIGSIVLEHADKQPDSWAKLFWAGVVFTGIGVFLAIRSGNDNS